MSRVRGWYLALLVGLLAPYVYTLFDSSDGDVPLYQHYATLLLGGAMPYRDWAFEYPPYALAWLVLPGCFSAYPAFRAAFSLQILVLDVLAKVVLLREGSRLAPNARLVPLLAFSALGICQAYFYLKRFDAIAAALTLLALVAVTRRRPALAAALLAFAVGTKLYPLVVVPALAYLAWQQRTAGRFVAAFAAALVPVALLSAFAPWWTFAAFHAARGLQVESTYASVLWFLHFFSLKVEWASRPRWLEVDGPAARAVVPIARVLFGILTTAAVAASVALVRHGDREDTPVPRQSRPALEPASPAIVARAMLLPLLAFMAFGLVLSPQFLVWLAGPAAIACTTRPRAPIVAVATAVALTALVFPAPGYFAPEGISFGRTLILVARNAALLVAFAMLIRQALGQRRARSG